MATEDVARQLDRLAGHVTNVAKAMSEQAAGASR